MEPRKVRYAEFREELRRYSTHDVIPFLAYHAAAVQPIAMTWEDRWAKGFPPWFFAGAARDSLVYGNRYRSKPLTPEAYTTLRNLFTESHDISVETKVDLAVMTNRFVYEQVPYQTSVMEELARPYLLFMDTDVPDQYRKPDSEDWREVLGCTVQEALNASFILFVGAMNSHGRFDPDWFEADQYKEHPVVSPAIGRHVLDLLTATVEEAREDGRSAPELPEALQRFAYNPLVKTPFIDIGDGLRYAPQPQFILRAMTTENLYYRGMRQWDKDFGAALGARVQAYTGRQLRHSGEHTVIEEFRWHQNKRGGVDSSDWFLVTPQVTVLIECKSARMGYAAKAGTPDGIKQANEILGRAFGQLKANADEIKAGNPAYAHIPADRPLVGLVVTGEPFHTANSEAVRQRLPNPGIPVLTISLRELEVLAAISPYEVGSALQAIVANKDFYEGPLLLALGQLVQGIAEMENALINDAYDNAFVPLSEVINP
jgi:hypothetical protein